MITLPKPKRGPPPKKRVPSPNDFAPDPALNSENQVPGPGLPEAEAGGQLGVKRHHTIDALARQIAVPAMTWHCLETQQFYWLTPERKLIWGGIDSLKKEIAELNDALSSKRIAAAFDRLVVYVRRHHAVHHVLPLAGYRIGQYDKGETSFLVDRNPTIIQPTYGDNTVMRDYVETLFGKGCQSTVAHAWLKLSRQALMDRDFHRSLQAMQIAGERDHGKSVYAEMMALMLGGRSADPTLYLLGKTTFNAHMFGAELLLIDDKGSHDHKERVLLRDGVKTLIAGTLPECHPKGETAFTPPKPLWRIMHLVNDDQEGVDSLPSMGDDRGKVVTLKTQARAIQAKTDSPKEFAAYRAALIASIPDYLGWLEKWEIPVDFLHQRFGLKSYHHPEIVAMMHDSTPEQRLGCLIREVLQSEEDQTFAARDVENILKDEKDARHGNQPTAREACDLLRGSGSCGRYLSRLSKAEPSLIQKDGIFHGGGTRWKIIAKRG
jgi:hypothetical protein